MLKQQNITIIGAGAWGTTLSVLLHNNGHKVSLWAVTKDLAQAIERARENHAFLPGLKIPPQIMVSSDPKLCKKANIILFAVPSEHLREVAKQFKKRIGKRAIIVSAVKGLENNTLKRMSEVLIEELGCSKNRVAVISGPNLAKEIAQGHPAATVAGSYNNVRTAKVVQSALMSPVLRVYTSSDVIGVELGGTLKNIIAIAAGVGDGFGFGDNAKSALIVRGMAEITRMGIALGGKKETFMGLSGIGDLITTCASKLSRNHYVGEQIAKGKKLADIVSSMTAVAEGVPTTRAVHQLAKKLKIEMPITEQVYQVLFEGKSPKLALQDLMGRGAKVE